jgi:hypothetical protein
MELDSKKQVNCGAPWLWVLAQTFQLRRRSTWMNSTPQAHHRRNGDVSLARRFPYG